jgi:protease I
LVLKNKKVLALVHQDYEDLELTYPTLRLREEGVEVKIAGEKSLFEYRGKYGYPIVSDCAYEDIDPEEFDGLIIPGGWAPDKLRRYPKVLKIVQHMDANNKPIGQICHAGWVLVSAGILKGKKVTSTTAIKDDMVNAGATWVDEAVVVDGTLISSRQPKDLPVYMKAYIEVLRSR